MSKYFTIFLIVAMVCLFGVFLKEQRSYLLQQDLKMRECPEPVETKSIHETREKARSQEKPSVVEEESEEEAVNDDDIDEDELEKKPKNLYFPQSLSKQDYEARGKLIGNTCAEVFTKWMLTSNGTPPRKPPVEIPEEYWNEYTLFGRIPVGNRYFDQRSVPSSRRWGGIDEVLDGGNVFSKSTYGRLTKVVLDAMKKFNEHFKDKHGAVIGSQKPWAEIMALHVGAASVMTIEYQKTEIQTKHAMSWIHPYDMAQNWTSFAGTFDFIVSYSSIEHSGLGRYGDPLDPWGDLREMAKVRCLLKENGVMIVGFPVGDDALIWNAHRIYGPIRLQWMMQGFRLLGVFWYTNKGVEFFEGFPLEFINPEDRLQGEQPAIVLQKMPFISDD